MPSHLQLFGLSLKRRIVGLLKRLPPTQYEALRRLYYGPIIWKPTPSFSQTGEDVIIQSLLKERMGSYADIGAGLPRRGNNTYLLYLRGWRGLCLDPITANIEAIRRERPGDQVVQALCSASVGTMDFFEFSDYEFSTVDQCRVQEVLATQDVSLVQATALPVVTLASLGLRATPDDPSFLSVDVEGHELEVLTGNDWNVYHPRVICVEEWESPIGSSTTIGDLLRDHGYNLKAYTGLSSIYVHGSWANR